MMLLKHKHSVSSYAFLVICTFVRLSYQQYTLVDNNLKSFLQHNTLSTIQTFWHDASGDCEIDIRFLIELHKKLQNIACAEDQFVILLAHHVRKQLIHLMSTQLKDALKHKYFRTNKIFEQHLKELQEIDKRAVKAIWAMAINNVDPEQIIDEIVLLQDEEVQIDAFQNLINKCILDPTKLETLIPLLTFHITSLFKSKASCTSLDKSLERLYCPLPKELRLLYEGPKQPYILTNHVRLPKDKQVICTLVALHDKGLVAFGIQLGGSVKYIYGDENKTIHFSTGSGVKANQLWQVIWPQNSYGRDAPGYVLFKNKKTGNLLCLDELKMIQLSAVENKLNPACYWLVSHATAAEIMEEC